MGRLWNRSVFIVLVAMLAITVQPAAAAPPEHWSYVWTGTDVIGNCGDFDIIDEWTEYGDATTPATHST